MSYTVQANGRNAKKIVANFPGRFLVQMGQQRTPINLKLTCNEKLKRKIDFSKIVIYLRVLLTKWPDICKPTFSAHYLFGCIIKSTHLGDVPKAKSWDLGAYTGLWGTI